MRLSEFPVFVGLLALSGCGDKGDTGIAGLAEAPCGDPCSLRDPNNFTYDSELNFEVVEAEAEADVCIDWSGLSTDIQGHAFTEGVDLVRLAVFDKLDYDGIRLGLVEDSHQQSELGLYMECEPDGPEDTDCCLSEFGLLGSVPGIDTYFKVDSGLWLFTLQSDDVDGARSMVMLEPSAESTVTLVEITDESSVLTIEPDLESGTDALIAPVADIEVDWSALTVDGLGNALRLERIDRLELGHYDATPTELEPEFFNLRDVATESWTMSVAGSTSADLSKLEGNTTFSGVTSDGTWLLALWCSACENPVPKFISVMGVDE